MDRGEMYIDEPSASNGSVYPDLISIAISGY